MDFAKVADNLEGMAGDLEAVYAANLIDAVTVYGAAQWLRQLAACLRASANPMPLRLYEPSLN